MNSEPQEDRALDVWGVVRRLLKNRGLLFELTSGGATVIYTTLLVALPNYLAGLGERLMPSDLFTVSVIQFVLVVVGIVALGLTALGTKDPHRRRYAMWARAAFHLMLGVTQILAAPQWAGGGLVNVWIALLSLPAVTALEIEDTERSREPRA